VVRVDSVGKAFKGQKFEYKAEEAKRVVGEKEKP
jgi:hypothetical protein